MFLKKRKTIIIAGCGRFGSNIGGILSERGSDVIVIDMDSDAFRKLPGEFSGYSIEGDAADIDVLENAGIEKADILLATTDNDNVNSMIAQIASRIFNVPIVIGRFYDTNKGLLLEGYNIKAIYPSRLSTNEFERITGINLEVK